MAELERLANHLGDIGAICNDAAFALMHAQTGVLRERVLRAAQACFGHRLMMDVIVPGGVARDIAPDGVSRDQGVARGIAPPLPAADRALRQHRLAAGPHRQHRHRQAGIRPPLRRRRFCRPRVGPRLRRAARVSLRALRPVDIRGAGARRRRRRCAGVDPHSRGRAEPGADRADRRRTARRSRHGRGQERARGRAKAWRWSRLSAATCWCGCGSMPTAMLRAATCATPPGSSGRCWRPRSRATSSPTSRSATNRSTAPIRATISRAKPCAARCSKA